MFTEATTTFGVSVGKNGLAASVARPAGPGPRDSTLFYDRAYYSIARVVLSRHVAGRPVSLPVLANSAAFLIGFGAGPALSPTCGRDRSTFAA